MLDNIDYIDWFVHEIETEIKLDSARQYEPDFYELEQIIHPSEYGGKKMDAIKFVTEEQQQLNFDNLMKELEEVKKPSELSTLASKAYKLTNEKEGGNFFYIGKEHKEQFWEAKKQRSAEFAESARKELDGLLKDELNKAQVAQINKAIYNSKVLDIDEKKAYWSKFKAKVGIETTEQDADNATEVA